MKNIMVVVVQSVKKYTSCQWNSRKNLEKVGGIVIKFLKKGDLPLRSNCNVKKV